MPYPEEGTLTTDERETAISETWDTQTEWEAYQSINNIEIINGTVQLLFSEVTQSESDGKLVHRWYLNEDTPPFIDQVGTADSTSVTGTAQVTGNWAGGSARSADGTDDVIETTSWGNFGGTMDQGFAIALSFSGSEGLISGNNTCLVGTVNDASNTFIQFPDPAAAGREMSLRDESGNASELGWANASMYEDNNPHRIVYNVPNPGDVSSWEIYADQSLESVSVTADENLSGFANFTYPVALFARNLRAVIDSRTNCILDDVCIFGESLTQEEATSYNNPWV